MSPTSKGIALTQISSGSAGSAGSLAFVSNALVAQGINIAAPFPLNVSNEGTYDWICTSRRGVASTLDLADPQTYRWKKNRGSIWVPGAGVFWNASSDLTPSFDGNGGFSISANAGDDAGLGVGGNQSTFPLTANRVSIGVLQNNTAIVPQGYGWSFRIPLQSVLRTINVYHATRVQFNGKTCQTVLTAHLMDGSAGDVSVTCGPNTSTAGGALTSCFKTVFQAKAPVFTYLIVTSVYTSNSITTVSGDASYWAAVTIS